jgi:hypothetical protein
MKPNARWGAGLSALAALVLAAMMAIALTTPDLVWDATNGPAPNDPNLPAQRAHAVFVYGLDMAFAALYGLAFVAVASLTKRKPIMRVFALAATASLVVLDGAENLAGLVRLALDPLLDFRGALAPTMLTAAKWAAAAAAMVSLMWLMPKRGYLTVFAAALLGGVYPIVAALAAWRCFRLGEGANDDPFLAAAVLGLGPSLIALSLWCWSEARRAL